MRDMAGTREADFESIFDLRGKLIWVVGGAGYLGQSVVKMLASAGARVVCADLADRSKAFVSQAGLFPQVIPVSLDIAEEEQVEAFVSLLSAELGVPDGAVNLTYAASGKAFDDLTAADFNRVNEVGLTAAFVFGRKVCDLMAQAGGGSFVTFGSMYGMVSPDPAAYPAKMNPNPIEYGVSKAGIIQMTNYFAMQYGKRGVRCNCVSPGPFPSPEVQESHPEFVQRLAEKTLLKRVGKAPEVAGAVCFLLSPASSFMTGHNLVVDGGWTTW
ncbi:MAG: SDR family oxidoreductase [Lunatimonas sp.]|uniref:SDR family oxidoreductase n=1 Tax=Lunatimonas sp. TaxID=2060141 RepID=UPI00263B0CF8|nr:SDR family oxidoreductase [Lunatimonas sp.]MCC5938346.1 SDR family oxidoreductase [Lunatimonas sp.]